MKPGFYFNETFRQNFYFFLGWKAEDYYDYCVKHFDYHWDRELFDLNDGKTAMLTNKSKGKEVVLIWTRHQEKKVSSQLAILAHECLHATNMTLDRIGYEVDLKNDEAQAYLFTEIFRQGLTFL